MENHNLHIKERCACKVHLNMPIKLFMVFVLTSGIHSSQAQTCEEVMKLVKTESYGTTFSSYNSDALSKVTFYDVRIDYQSLYFAIVCFKSKNSYSCSEYIYQVSSNTKMYYSSNYLTSAGEAFWKYIQPHNDNLGCGPDID